MSTQTDPRVEDLLARMTVAEKAAQIGCGFTPAGPTPIPEHGAGGVAWPETTHHHPPRVGAAVRNKVQRDVIAASAHGIPTLINEEGLDGLKIPFASVLPDAIGQAATWDPELIQEMATIVGRQMAEVGVQQALAPLCDVVRDPRWGRIEETYGEDPYLVGTIATAFVRGMQSQGPRGRMATLKHYVAYSASDGGRNLNPAHVGPRTLREVHGLGFEMAIREGGARSIMCSYNTIDGEPVQSSHEVLTGLLRDEYGFTGVAISDLGSVEQLQSHHGVTDSHAGSIVLSVAAGLDLELASTPAVSAIVEAVGDGRLSEEVLNRAVGRVLAMKIELGLFDDPFVDEDAVPEVLDTPQDRAVARRVAERSIVLLRNEPVGDRPLLPIGPDVKTIALIGPNADRAFGLLGNYSCPVLDSAVARMTDIMNQHATQAQTQVQDEPRTFGEMFAPKGTYADAAEQTVDTVPVITVLEGMRARAGDAIGITHERGCGIEDPDASGIPAAVAAASASDLAIVVVGDQSGIGGAATVGEGVDSAGCALPGIQRELVESVVASGTPTVVVLTHGRPFILDWLVACAPAIVSAWFPGEEGGPAVAAALFGDVNPGGKTPVSFLPHAGVAPLPYNRTETGGNTYRDATLRSVFPFGHGLSYTTFEYGDLRVGPDAPTTSDTVRISCTVTNAGTVTGDEVVQLYVRDPVARTARPRRELKGFQRVTLEPGATADVTFVLHADRVALYDPTDGWVVEPGLLHLMVGSSSEDIRARADVELSGPVRQAGTRRVLVTPVEVGAPQG
jgi:beta-glucosidase-like glycosyl hydrolase